MDWHHGASPRQSYATYRESPPASYENHYHQPQPPQPPPDVRYPYGHPPMSSRTGGAPPPPESSYWYEGQVSGVPPRRHQQAPPPPPALGGPGWHHHSMHHENESSYEHSMPPPPHHQQGYPYPYFPDMKKGPPPSNRRGRGVGRPPPPSMNMSAAREHSPRPPRPLQPRRMAGSGTKVGSAGSELHNSPQYTPPPASPRVKKSQEKSAEKSHDKKPKTKSGDPLSLLAKVSSDMAHGGKKKEGGKSNSSGDKESTDEQTTEEESGPTPISSPNRTIAHGSQSQIITPISNSKPSVSKQRTPASAAAAEHTNYPSRDPPMEPPYWPGAELDYPRHSHIRSSPPSASVPPPVQMPPHRDGGRPPTRHPHPQQHHYPYPRPPPQHPSHPHDAGWGPTESPPALVERGTSFESHELDHRYGYYPRGAQQMFDPQVYDRPAGGPPPGPPKWKDYPPPRSNAAASSRSSQHPHGMTGHSPWALSGSSRREMMNPGSGAGGPTPPSTPPQHIYPPPRWSYELGRQHPGYPPTGPRMNSMGEPSRLPHLHPASAGNGDPSLSSTPPRGPSYPGASKYTPPYHAHPYHHPRHPLPHPAGPPHSHAHRKDPNRTPDANNPPSPGKNCSSNSRMYAPYTYVQQPHMEEKTILRKKFSWKHYPELERFLIANRDEYLRHSSMNYTAEQKQYNNWLTDRLLEVAEENHYAFDPEDFNFVAIRDRIRCYYKSYVQTARKRGLSLPTKESNKKANTCSSPSPDKENEEGDYANNFSPNQSEDNSET